jgi:hypothetical protein
LRIHSNPCSVDQSEEVLQSQVGEVRSDGQYPLGMTPRAVSSEIRKSLFVHDGLGHDGTSGITSTEKQDIVASLHGGHLSLRISVECGSRVMSVTASHWEKSTISIFLYANIQVLETSDAETTSV